MADLLSIGASGARAYARALDTIGSNIVNAETEGYARRNVVLREGAGSGGAGGIYIGRLSFGGVETTGAKRAWDDFRAADSRMSGAAASRTAVRVRWMEATEDALADGATGVGQSVTNLYNAAETLAADPGNTSGRRAFLQAVDGAAAAFRATADSLSRLSDGIAGEASTQVDAANADIAALAKLNAALRRTTPGSTARLQLSDERDRLLDGLSNRLEIDVALADDGTARVTLPRSGGTVLVDNTGIGPAELQLARAADGRLALSVFSDGDLSPHTPAAGALAGLVETAGLVSDRRAELDTLAQDFAAALNDWSAAGTDATGAAGTALLAGTGAATLAPAIANRDPATVAAALAIDNGDGTTRTVANGNLLALPALRATTGTEAGWAQLVAGQSQILSSARSEDAATAARRDGAYAARDDISGVDLDYEASELLRFQQAYNGAAKIIQVARETLQSIMDVL